MKAGGKRLGNLVTAATRRDHIHSRERLLLASQGAPRVEGERQLSGSSRVDRPEVSWSAWSPYTCEKPVRAVSPAKMVEIGVQQSRLLLLRAFGGGWLELHLAPPATTRRLLALGEPCNSDLRAPLRLFQACTASMSALAPKMFMTRLRLYARTWRLISVPTFSKRFIRKWV